ncbi:hypothetical protein E1301_Tti018226 [Triplophysa tibetana]|uniref:Immunoglobulin V-set domain-containing protein n=1 Tax=Triplophysa tibetana TaxID=1572043 RepID=A0A5A9NSE3_9TELE|nr:hypothetical protein E1301_Tti018226 [Triplophysa tibetana]
MPVYDIFKGKLSVEHQEPRFKNKTEIFPDDFVRGIFSIQLNKLEHTDAGEYECYIIHSGEHVNVQLLINERAWREWPPRARRLETCSRWRRRHPPTEEDVHLRNAVILGIAEAYDDAGEGDGYHAALERASRSPWIVHLWWAGIVWSAEVYDNAGEGSGVLVGGSEDEPLFVAARRADRRAGGPVAKLGTRRRSRTRSWRDGKRVAVLKG